MQRGARRVAGAMLAAGFLAGPSAASELIYRPVNPNFGGNPFNGDFLLNGAVLQNDHEESRANLPRSDDFEGLVNRLVLNSIARALLGNITDPLTGELVPGTIDTGINTITINDLGAELEIQIMNNATGEITTVIVPD